MSITLPTAGQANWNTPLDAALTALDADIQTRLTTTAATATYATQLTSNDAVDFAGTGQVRNPPGLGLRKVGRVLAPGAAGAFDSCLVESPCVFFDPVSKRWAMVYVAYTQASGSDGGISVAVTGSLGLAFSNDLVTWTKDSQFLAGSGAGADSAGCSGAKVVYDGSLYHIYYIGLTATGYEGGTPSLCYATKTTLTGSAARYGAIVSPSGSGWRQNKVYVCSIPVLVNGTYHIFINAAAGDSKETIGHATASSLAGPWTIDDANSPVLNVTAAAWDSFFVGDPGVFREGDTWWMSYYGAVTGPADPSDGWAYTSVDDFPYGWTKHAANPIYAHGASGEFDSTYAHKPFILRAMGGHYHYYTADNGTSRHIGLAVDPSTQVLAANAKTKISAVTTSYTYASTSWTEIDSGMRIQLPAQAGDVIEVSLSGVFQNDAVDGFLDVKTVDGAAYFGAGGTDATQNGAGQWFGPASRYQGVGGTQQYTLLAANVSGGYVTLTPVMKCGTAANKTLLSTAGTRFAFSAKNLGRHAVPA